MCMIEDSEGLITFQISHHYQTASVLNVLITLQTFYSHDKSCLMLFIIDAALFHASLPR